MFSFSSILTDTRNFISNNFMIIFVSILVLSILTQSISFFLYPDIHTISQIVSLIEQSMDVSGKINFDVLSKTILALPPQEQQSFINAIGSFYIKAGLVFFINNLILASAILALIYTISYQDISTNNFLKSTTKFLPQILLFLLLIIPGGILLSILATVLMPIAILLALFAIIFYFSLYIIFLAVLITPTQQSNFFKKLHVTFRFLKREIGLILAALAIWFLSAFVLNTLVSAVGIDNFIFNVVINFIKSFLMLTIICYLYRLFSLSDKALPYDARN